ncbi:MAG: 6-hydroxymethylpterin diphosphokinase MptE-like protein [Spirochaetota bacterium]
MTLLETALSLLPNDVAHFVSAADRRPDEVHATSRDGASVNGLQVGGRTIHFHSRYSALREAERLADSAGDARFAVVIGFGMGHHVRALARRGVRSLVVEPDAALLRSALERGDFVELIRSGHLALASDDPHSLVHTLGRSYLPALDGDLAVVELPGRVAAEPERLAGVRSVVRHAVDALKDDLAVQTRFAAVWARNTLLNAARVSSSGLPDWRGLPVTVAAAGPSLEGYLAGRAARPTDRLVAVDTALPVLIAHGIRPDLVVSIDCQLTTYHHFLSASFPALPTVAELSLPPSLLERLASPLPVLGNHPLHALLAHHGLPLPHIETSSGNVAQASVELAARLGASRVTLVGADFSYPDGRTYPRGSYIDRYFRSRAGRLGPLAGALYRFLMDRPGLTRLETHDNSWTQPTLTTYATRMAGAVASLGIPVERIRANGIELRAIPEAGVRGSDRAEAPRREPPPALRAIGAATRRRALGATREALFAIPGTASLRRAATDASAPHRLAAHAFLPLLTRLAAGSAAVDPEELFAAARAAMGSTIDQALRLCQE